MRQLDAVIGAVPTEAWPYIIPTLLLSFIFGSVLLFFSQYRLGENGRRLILIQKKYERSYKFRFLLQVLKLYALPGHQTNENEALEIARAVWVDEQGHFRKFVRYTTGLAILVYDSNGKKTFWIVPGVAADGGHCILAIKFLEPGLFTMGKVELVGSVRLSSHEPLEAKE